MQSKTKPFLYRQARKLGDHRLIQERLKTLLPPNEAQIESPFPKLRRIADLAWATEKIIFEVQCSPISLEEVLLRNADYARAGYAVIWILHDTSFNQKHLSAAEVFLRGRVTYFVHIGKNGEILIYDQQEKILKSQRLFKGFSLPIPLKKPFSKIKPLCALTKKKKRKSRAKNLYQILFLFLLKKNSL